ncbi:ribbon-helix-helix protein, CopG family [uncultured Desulfovibrio sp.]|uniref:ribbon-helix-helix protein, CopG family n=1 Tax=uncultured Desulfovibrio sp. TaxID=167968 RepID=UPI0026DC92E3|nr:ribbon-helix-helix protein, CopG family [uncultured Desulfovibrio sp.]
MTLIDCIKALLTRDDADSLRLDDGATTWDLDNLYDAVINSEDYDESVEYSVQADGIYALDADGYLISPPAYRIKGPRGGRRPGAGRKPGSRSPRKKKANQVTLPPELWERINEARAVRGLSLTAAFEEMALDWLDKATHRQ